MNKYATVEKRETNASLTTCCPVCEARTGEPLLRRPQAPVNQNVVYPTSRQARAAARGDFLLTCCPDCGFLFNQAFNGANVAYGKRYDNTQTYSPRFLDHVESLLGRLASDPPLKEGRILEIGCGDGGFLRRLVELHPGNTGIGLDPSYRGPDQDSSGRIRFERRHFRPADPVVEADLVIMRHVIEHIPDPVPTLRHVRRCLPDGGLLYLETPSLDWILENDAFWDFFHEHCSYFSPPSIRRCLREAGFSVQPVELVFEGQYMWVRARRSDSGEASRREVRQGDSEQSGIKLLSGMPATETLCSRMKAFSDREVALIGKWRGRISSLRARGGVAIWGAGAKGVTFASLVDPTCELIDCLVDLNPNKQGKCVAGSAHQVVSWEELPGRGVTAALVMNPNYSEEIRPILERLNIEQICC